MNLDDRSRPTRAVLVPVDAARTRLGLSWRSVALIATAVAIVTACAVVLAGVTEDVVGSDGLAARDPSTLHLFVSHRTELLVRASRGITDLGAVPVLIPLALAVAVVLWFGGARLAMAITPAVSLAVAGALSGIGKAVVGRARPGASVRLVGETDASFPSGHSADSAAVYLALGLVVAIVVFHKPLIRALSVAAGAGLAAMIGVSRLVLGVHWPTDVVAGLALGTGVAIAVTTVAALTIRWKPLGPESQQGTMSRWWQRAQAVLCAQRPPQRVLP